MNLKVQNTFAGNALRLLYNIFPATQTLQQVDLCSLPPSPVGLTCLHMLKFKNIGQQQMSFEGTEQVCEPLVKGVEDSSLQSRTKPLSRV